MRYRIAQRSAGSVLALGLALGGVQCAQAAAENGAFAIRGLGAQRCQDVVAVFDADGGDPAIAAALGHWIGGYLTQANRSTSGVFEVLPVMDIGVVARMALNVCRANPDSLVEPAVAAMIARFQAVAQTTETPVVEAKSDRYAVRLRRDVLRRVQEALAAGGFLSAGAADGVYGPRTRQALAAYQTKQGLTVTGVPDPATLITLLVGE